MQHGTTFEDDTVPHEPWKQRADDWLSYIPAEVTTKCGNVSKTLSLSLSQLPVG